MNIVLINLRNIFELDLIDVNRFEIFHKLVINSAFISIILSNHKRYIKNKYFFICCCVIVIAIFDACHYKLKSLAAYVQNVEIINKDYKFFARWRAETFFLDCFKWNSCLAKKNIFEFLRSHRSSHLYCKVSVNLWIQKGLKVVHILAFSWSCFSYQYHRIIALYHQFNKVSFCSQVHSCHINFIFDYLNFRVVYLF